MPWQCSPKLGENTTSGWMPKQGGYSFILELPVDLPRPRTPEMRYSDTFSELTHMLRDTLQDDNGYISSSPDPDQEQAG